MKLTRPFTIALVAALVAALLAPGFSAFATPTPVASALTPPVAQSRAARFEIGAGMADITGPASGVGMMGYSMPGQRTGGLHTRLYARAFVIASPQSGERVALVVADQLAVFEAVRQEVLRRLEARFGDRYSEKNTVLMATHTHSGPGGTSHFATYDLSILGFDPVGFEVVVSGVVEAIARADARLAPGTVRFAEGELWGASVNRSPEAQAGNERELLDDLARVFGGDLDRRMALLRFDAADGGSIGVVDFFGVHATSMGNDNRLISADNKGFAAIGWERLMNGQPRGAGDLGERGSSVQEGNTREESGRAKSGLTTENTAFVAAFAPSASGDASPNVLGGTDGGGADDFESAAISGQRQLDRAIELHAQAGEAAAFLDGVVDSRFVWLDMSAAAVAPRFADGESRTTCKAAYGLSMIAGAEDGPGFGREGQTCDALPGPLRALLCRDACHAEKPVVLSAGNSDEIHFSPSIVPIQIARVGGIALVATPFEITTAAARVIEREVHGALAQAGVRRVVVLGPSNGYASYLTTRGEYALQHYEGASNHFGPWALGAVTQTAVALAEAMARGESVDAGTPPPDLSREIQVVLDSDDFDAAPLFRDFGEVIEDVAQSLQPGDTARASFVGASLNHCPTRHGGFMAVEREVNGRFEVVARDSDVETKVFWQRQLCPPSFRCSRVTLEWRIPEDAPPGSYRLRYLGTRQPMDGGELRDFEGVSRVFQVRAFDAAPRDPVALSAPTE